MTPTKTVSEPRRSERVAVQTGQTITYKTLHRKQSFIFCVMFCRSLFVQFERLPFQSAWLHSRF
jgi:hypothetical protein